MNETQLLRICLGVAALGIISLFFLAETMEAKELGISEITPSFIGQTVSVTGTVSKISVYSGMTFIILEESGNSFPVVFFQELDDIFVDEKISVFGKVQEYKGSLQIVGERYSRRNI